MEIIQESDYVLFKALSEFIVKNGSERLKVLTEKCNASLAEYEKIKARFNACQNYEELGVWSKKLEEKRQTLFGMIAVQDRMNKVVERNKARLELFKTKLDGMGIYNDVVDKKLFSNALAEEKDKLSEDGLNLNPAKSGGVIYKFFAGKIVAFKNGEPDLSLEYNQNLLSVADSSFFHDLVSAFPSCVGTLTDDEFMILSIKHNILRESVLYVASKMKTQTIKQSNAELGIGMVNLANISNIEEYAKELKNFFNVCVKQNLKNKMPDFEQEINGLKCVEWSEFLPASRRVAPLSQGLAGDAPKTEAEESEEVRKEQEKEAQKELTAEQLLDMLLADDEEDLDMQEEAQEQQKKIEEEIKLNEERKQQEELEQMKQMGLRKTTAEDD